MSTGQKKKEKENTNYQSIKGDSAGKSDEDETMWSFVYIHK